MKNSLFVVLLLCAGCSLLPKKVEYFQRKVKALPELSEKGAEAQKEAAEFVARKTQEAKESAIREQATNTAALAFESAIVARALSVSLGPPISPFPTNKPAAVLAEKVSEDKAKLDLSVQKYADHVEKDVGKKIEGTGVIKIGYFTQLAVLFGVLFLIFAGLKIYGMVNPVVGLGVGAVQRVGSSVLAKGFAELTAGGEKFKKLIATSVLTPENRAAALDIFNRAHAESHSADVADLVSKA